MRDPQWSKVVLAMPMLGPNNGVAFYDLKGHPCTTNGNTKIHSATSKFGGGSAFFDGVSDWIAITSNLSDFAFGIGDFTIEAWVYHVAPGWPQTLLDKTLTYGAGGVDWKFEINASNQLAFLAGPNVDWVLGGPATVVPPGQWVHVAVSRRAVVTYIFVGGVLSGQTSFAYNIGNLKDELSIGAYNSSGHGNYFNGWMEDLRITKGYGKYTADFPVPTALLGTGDLYWDNVILALDGQGLHDFKGKALVNGNSATSIWVGTRSKWGGNSIYFNGTNAYLTCNAVCAALVGNPDFTIEGWFYQETVQGGQNVLFSFHDSTGANRLVVTYAGFFGGTGNTIPAVTLTDALVVLGAWTHVTVSHKAGVLTFFKNGRVLAKYSNCQPNIVGTDTFSIGQEYDGASPTDFFKGNLNDFRVTVGVVRYSENFVLPVVHPDSNVADASFASNILLLHGDGQDNYQNHTFIDSSAVPKSITRFGDVVQGTPSPFPVVAGQSYEPLVNLGSAYFDGTGDYLTIPYDSDMARWWDSEFTIEMWVKSIANHSDTSPLQLIQGDPIGAAKYWGFGTINTGAVSFYYYNGVGASVTGTTLLSLNNWHHIAMTYSGGLIRVFVNGVMEASSTVSGTPQVSGSYGFGIGGYSTIKLNGFIADLHVVKGLARYTATFVPPTSPATAVTASDTNLVSVAALLPLVSATSYARAIGSGTVGGTSPVMSTVTKKYVASAFFAGPSSYDRLAAGTFAFGNQDYAIEFWVNIDVTNPTAFPYLMSSTVYNAGAGFYMTTDGPGTGWGGTGKIVFNASSGLANGQGVATTSVIRGAGWKHIAITRAGAVLRMFVDGILENTNTETAVSNHTATGANICSASSDSSGTIVGSSGEKCYIEDLRITKGVARYTANFTPPGSLLGTIGRTVLLLKNTNAGVRDETGKNHVILGGDTKVKTTQSKFGTSSIYFDGAGDGIIIPYKATNVLALDDFTIEFWMHPLLGGRVGGVSDTRLIVYGTDGIAGLMVITCYATESPTRIGVYTYTTGYVNLMISTITVPNDAWSHVALCRSGTTWSLFINGMMTNQATLSFSISQAAPIYIGRNSNNGENYYGYLDDYRITKGVARYNSTSFNSQAFTPPARSMMAVDTRTFSGTIADTEPGSKAHRVRLYERSNGQLVAETTSDPVTGVYSVTVDSAEQHTVLFLDETGRNALVRDLVSGA